MLAVTPRKIDVLQNKELQEILRQDAQNFMKNLTKVLLELKVRHKVELQRLVFLKNTVVGQREETLSPTVITVVETNRTASEE